MSNVYYLDDISAALAGIAHSLATLGLAHAPGFAEEIKAIEAKLRQFYPNFPRDPYLFAASAMINAMVLGIAAAEDRAQRVDARTEKHARNAKAERHARVFDDKLKH